MEAMGSHRQLTPYGTVMSGFSSPITLAMAAIAAGADGLMIEVHNNPEKALCDGAQSLTPEKFDHLMKKVNKTVDFFHTLG